MKPTLTRSIVALVALLTLTASAFAAPPLRIALVSDPHTNEATSGDEMNYKARFQHVIADVNASHVDFVLVAGDLTQGGKPEQMADFAAQMKGFQAPVRVVCGNHDVGQKLGVIGAKPDAHVTAERVARYEAAFGPSFWRETLAGVRVIGLNTPILGSGLPVEAAQWAFLERELAPTGRSVPPTLLVTHYPLYLKTSDEPGGIYWNVEPAPRARLLALIKGSGSVRAVLSGHLHRPLQNKTPEGVLLYTTPPVSFGLPQGKQPEGWTLLTLTPDGSVTAKFHPTDPPVLEKIP